VETWQVILSLATGVAGFVGVCLGLRNKVLKGKKLEAEIAAPPAPNGQQNTFHNVTGTVNVTRDGDIVTRKDFTA
jgi:hypothetical protein